MSKTTQEGSTKKKDLKPLKIKCTSSNCGAGLHCFRQTKKMAETNQGGRCRSCGANLVDWKRVHQKDTKDAAYTFRMLKYELIRHHFWHVEIDQRAVNYARRKGWNGLRLAAERRIRTAVGAANPAFDGRQTPRAGNAIYYAQHATASCCRKCIEEWHGIPPGRPLSEQEISYMTELVVLYVRERLPGLTQQGETVAPIRGPGLKASSGSAKGARRDEVH